MRHCRICRKSVKAETYRVREMMLGLNGEFEYFQCSSCGCLQITEIPENLGDYYPDNYYSFSLPVRKPMRRMFRNLRLKLALSGLPAGRLLAGLFGLPPVVDWISRSRTNRRSRVLDVGSGAGTLLQELAGAGFTNLLGIDPYLSEEQIEAEGFTIRRQALDAVDGVYDLIIFNHSLEHVPDQESTLRTAARLVSRQGAIIVRVPIVESFAWHKYGVNWVQLDAPRHLYLHTRRSIEQLARNAGLEVFDSVSDSTEFQFWGSEFYAKGIPLLDSENGTLRNPHSLFSKQDIRTFKDAARKLNASGQGDQITFFLRRPDSPPHPTETLRQQPITAQ